jgi:membrane protein DedA with SNARE-associated domain
VRPAERWSSSAADETGGHRAHERGPRVIFDHLEWILFAWVLGNQSGLPVPVVPALLGAGALAGSARLSLSRIIVVAVGAALSADLAWYGLGRWRGERMLRMLARLSPTAIPLGHRARHVFVTHVGAFQLGARFLPELNAISAGLAGTARVSIVRFAFYGLASAVTWAGGWIGLGYLVSDAVTATAARLGVRLIALLLAPFALYLLFHRARRHRVIQLFRRARMSPEELSAVLEKSDRAHGRRIRILDGSDDARPAATVGTGEDIEIERMAHQRRPSPGVRGDGGALVAGDLRSGPT